MKKCRNLVVSIQMIENIMLGELKFGCKKVSKAIEKEKYFGSRSRSHKPSYRS